MTSAAGRARPTSHSYFSQGLKLHFLDWGNESAAPVLLVHGSQDHCHNWDWTSEQLCQNYHVIAADLRGHGDSEWAKGSTYGIYSYVYDIAQLIDQQNLAPVHLVGHSLGGTVATLFAGLYPEKVASLVSIEGVGAEFWDNASNTPLQDRIRELFEATRSQAGRLPKRYETLEAAFTRMQTSNPHLSEDRARHLTIHGSNRNEDGTYSWKFDPYTYTGWLAMDNRGDMREFWTSIDCPVLLINATDGYEHRIGQDDTLKYFKDCRLNEIEEAGHWLHHDQFEQFLTLLSDFLLEQA